MDLESLNTKGLAISVGIALGVMLIYHYVIKDYLPETKE